MNWQHADRLIRLALDEDLGMAGDITGAAVFARAATVAGRIVAREPGVVAGLEVAERVMAIIDEGIVFEAVHSDGDRVGAGTVLATVEGPARRIVAGERVALNFLGRMSGIATSTARMVELVADTGARIAATRKTAPGLRVFDKAAVVAGGGLPHRFGLYDAVMIKDNHIAVAGGVAQAVTAVRSRIGHTVTIEVEVDDLAQLAELIDIGADVVLLDNMAPSEMRKAVDMVGGRMVVEASGGIDETTIRSVAETGVDVISVGALTHSVRNLDVALDVDW